MTLNQLRYFTAVCRLGSVTAAASELHISQPSVSSSVRELEEEFGVNLFHRVGRRLHLTKEGEYLLMRGTALLEDSETLIKTMRDYGNSKNQIQVGVPPMIGSSIYPDLFRTFSQSNPQVRVDIWEQNSRQSCQLVERDSLDLAIVILSEVDPAVLRSLKMYSTQICFCVKNDSPLSELKTIDPKLLADVPIAMFSEGSYHAEKVLERFALCDVQPNVVVSSGQLQTIMEFVRQGLAGAFLFAELAREEGLVAIPFKSPIEMDIGLVWKRDKYIYRDAMKFIECVRERYPETAL